MKTKLFNALKKTSVFTAFFLIFASCVSNQANNLSQDDQYGGNQIPGSWIGKQNVKVRFTNGWFKFQFVESSDSISTQFSIDDQGNVLGHIGNARLENAYVVKNRGAIGRTLNLATDYSIRGNLIGYVFEGDTIARKKIMIPFVMVNGKLSGDLFQNQGMDVYPMCSIILHKQ